MNTELLKSKNFAENIRKEFQEKADKNKKSTDNLFRTILITTIFSPVLILFPFDMYFPESISQLFSKVIPAILTGITAFSTGWLNIKKPQDKWTLYRTAQREVELELTYYENSVNGYTLENREKKIIEETTRIYKDKHFAWVKIVPKLDDLNSTPNS